MVYKWKFFEYSVDAQTVGETLEKIEAENGEVTAGLLLEEARPVESKVHSLFEWNDSIAAEKYRLRQATQVISAVAVTYNREEDKEPLTVRAFVNVGERNNGSFITTARAFSSTETREIVLQHALEELKAFRAKYAALTELSEVFDQIDSIAV